MESLLALGGMVVNVVKQIARTKHRESDFDWKAWLGERPWQVAVRVALVLGVLLPQAQSSWSQTMWVQNETVDSILPILVGKYGDQIAQKVLEIAESYLRDLPFFSKLLSIGKKLT